MNKMTSQKIMPELDTAKRLERLAMVLSNGNQLIYAASILRRVASGELAEVVRCGECKLHGSCTFEETFITAGLDESRRYCGAGRRKD